MMVVSIITATMHLYWQFQEKSFTPDPVPAGYSCLPPLCFQVETGPWDRCRSPVSHAVCFGIRFTSSAVVSLIDSMSTSDILDWPFLVCRRMIGIHE